MKRTPGIKSVIGTIALATGIITSTASVAATVSVDGKNWRQLTETTGFSFNAVASLCPEGGGACSGSLDGWTWATVNEVQSLFHSYNPAFVVNGGLSDTDPETNNNAWASAFLADFNKTLGAPGFFPTVQGWTATLRDSTFAYFGEVSDSFLAAPTGDRMRTGRTPISAGGSPLRGVWLYETSPVPLPAAAWFFLSAMGGLVAAKQRQLQRSR